MLNLSPDTLLDIVVILLLVPTLFFAVVLNNRLSALRKSRDELAKVVNSFNEATMRAEAGIPRLKRATAEANTTLQERMEKAQSLRDDLAFMVQRAEEMAERLDDRLKSARADAPMAPVQPPPAAAPAAGVEPRVAGRQMPPQAAAPAPQQAPAAMMSEQSMESDLRGALEAARAEASAIEAKQGTPAATLADRAMMEADEPTPSTDDAVALEEERSQAERELLKALQSAR